MTSGLVRTDMALHSCAVGSEGDEIRWVRQARGLSIQALADGSNISVSSVKRIEAGRAEGSRSLRQVQHFLRIGPYAGEVAAPPSPRPNLDAMNPAQLASYIGMLLAEHNRTAAELAAAQQQLAQRLNEAAREQPPSRPRRSPPHADQAPGAYPLAGPDEVGLNGWSYETKGEEPTG